jgi:pimeloyl-ACP methyl ester carboxylesterase
MEAVEASVPASNGGTLAARVFYPRTLGVPRAAPDLPRAVAAACNGACALVVHQYSVMGGSQDLMRGIAREFATRHGVVAVTFNLRGVGGSSGRCTLTGHGEADDVADVGRWLQAAGFARILLVCSSAGAPIGGSALDRVPAFTACVLRVRAARASASARAWACGVLRGAGAQRRAKGHGQRSALTHCVLVVWSADAQTRAYTPQLCGARLRLRLLGVHPVRRPLHGGAGVHETEALRAGTHARGTFLRMRALITLTPAHALLCVA